MKKNFLIFGGASGVGLGLTKHYVREGHHVTVADAVVPDFGDADFATFEPGPDVGRLSQDVDALIAPLDAVHTLVCATHARPIGRIDALSDTDVVQGLCAGFLAPLMIIRRLRSRSDWPLKVMLMTSSAQYDASEEEPLHCAIQAALGMLGASLVRDRGLGKVLIAASPQFCLAPLGESVPSGVSTEIYDWLATCVVDLSGGAFKYKSATLDGVRKEIRVLECLDNDMAPIEAKWS